MRPSAEMTLSGWIRAAPRVTTFLWLGVVGLRLTPWRLYDTYADPLRQLELARLIDDAFGADFVHPLDHGWLFSEILGTALVVSPQDFPVSARDVCVRRGEVRCLRVPDPACERRMVADLRSLELIAEWSAKPVYVSVEGPFTLANDIAGMASVIPAVVREPGWIDELMLFTTEVVKRYARAVVAAGADLIILSEPQAANLSATEFERFVLPACRDVLGAIGCWKGMHVCGRVDHLIDGMLACGAECLSLEREIDFPRLARSLPCGTVLLGNLEPLLFIHGSPAEVRHATERLLETMKGCPDFIIAPGCDLPPETPPANIHAFLGTVRAYDECANGREAVR